MKYRNPFLRLHRDSLARNCRNILSPAILRAYLAERAAFGAKKPDIPVASDFGGVIAAVLMIAKFICRKSSDIQYWPTTRFSPIRCSQRAEALIRSKEPPFEFYIETVSASVKTGLRVTIYTALAEAKSRARTEYVAFSGRYKRIPIPCCQATEIADLYAVEEYPHVLAAHTTDVDGFQPPIPP